MKINVSEVINSNNASVRDNGLIVYEIAKKELKKDENVEISFEGITIVISSFLNAAIGKLYGDFSYEYVDQHITINGLADDDLELLYETVIPNAKEYYANKEKVEIAERSVLGQ